MQRANRCLVLKILMENGSMTRQKLSLKTGLHKATITNIINEFLEIGILSSDNGDKTGKRGELLRFQSSDIYTLSVSINRKDYRICLYTLDGNAAARIRKQFSLHENMQKVCERLLSDVQELLAPIPKKNVIGICVGLPGPYIFSS